MRRINVTEDYVLKESRTDYGLHPKEILLSFDFADQAKEFRQFILDGSLIEALNDWRKKHNGNT